MYSHAFIWAGTCARRLAKALTCFSVFSLICAGFVCAACHAVVAGQFKCFNADSPQSYFFQHIRPILFIDYLKVSFNLHFSYLIRFHTFNILKVHNYSELPNNINFYNSNYSRRRILCCRRDV